MRRVVEWGAMLQVFSRALPDISDRLRKEVAKGDGEPVLVAQEKELDLGGVPTTGGCRTEYLLEERGPAGRCSWSLADDPVDGLLARSGGRSRREDLFDGRRTISEGYGRVQLLFLATRRDRLRPPGPVGSDGRCAGHRRARAPLHSAARSAQLQSPRTAADPQVARPRSRIRASASAPDRAPPSAPAGLGARAPSAPAAGATLRRRPGIRSPCWASRRGSLGRTS